MLALYLIGLFILWAHYTFFLFSTQEIVHLSNYTRGLLSISSLIPLSTWPLLITLSLIIEKAYISKAYVRVIHITNQITCSIRIHILNK